MSELNKQQGLVFTVLVALVLGGFLSAALLLIVAASSALIAIGYKIFLLIISL